MEFPRLDKTQFTKKMNVLAITVPVLKLSSISSKLKKYLWTHSKPITASPNHDETKKIILLDSQYNDIELNFLPSELRESLMTDDVAVNVVEKEYGYDQMSTNEILSLVIPNDVEKVMAFETAGHIAHMNLRDGTEKYKYVIGQVILDKNKHIKTVVNKTGEINSIFRTFDMEIIAGENNLISESKECGCRYQFDFSKVYWNSRLGMEHERLVQMFSPGQVIADMFCGIGPFALPASKKGCIVHANDLNPSSFHYLKQNAELNKCKVFAYNMDGGEFIKHLFTGENRLKTIDHVIMNLPASAISFLSYFVGINNGNEDNPILPFIHCYGFSMGDKPDEDIIKQAQEVLGKKITNARTFNVRSVSTNKHMMRLSFKLTLELSSDMSEVIVCDSNEKKRKFEALQ